jgi:polyhydroxybutyrate depolymerase
MVRKLLLLLVILISIFGVILYRNMGPTLACGLRSSDDFRPGLTLHSITSDGVKRCYWLTLPPESADSSTMALIFSLHAFASNPRGQRSYSRWDDVASAHNAAVVYPQGSGFPQRWNSFGNARLEEPDDVAFFRDMLEELEAELPIDPDQIYVTGFSNGAAMTLRLLCEAGELITAAGMVAAPVTSSIMDCEPNHPVPLIAFHGSADPVLDIDGWDLQTDPSEATALPVRQGRLFGFTAWTEAWALKSGCYSPAIVFMDTDQVRGLRYVDSAGGIMLEAYTVFGGGHTWPGGRPIPFVGLTARSISASEVMWDFFQAVSDP